MALKCDVQYGIGSSGFKLTKVGVSKVRKPVLIGRPGMTNPLNSVVNCTVDVFVDLPATQRGSHLSRNVEVLREVAEESVKQPVSGLENMAVDMVKRLLVKHEYALNAYVDITGEYFKANKTPTGRDTLEYYTIRAGPHGVRNGEIRKTIGVDACGMTACPCAQETVGELLNVSEPGFPMMSHNQRNICSIYMTTGVDCDIEADDLIDLAEKAVSTPTFELLKREDEGNVVINAHTNTRFVEDVVRNGLTLVVKNYSHLAGNTVVKVCSDSEESIHKHNAYAERIATLDDLREEVVKNIIAE